MTIPRLAIWRQNEIEQIFIPVPHEVVREVVRVVEPPQAPPLPEEIPKEDEEVKIPDPLPSVLDPISSEDIPMDVETLNDAASADPNPKTASHHPDSLKESEKYEEFRKMVNHFTVVSALHKKEYANRIYDFILNNGLKVDINKYPAIKNLLDLGQY